MSEVSRRHRKRLQFYGSYVTPVVLAVVGMCTVVAYVGLDARLFNTLAAVALIVAAAWVAVEAARRYFEHVMSNVEERVRERLAEELCAVSAQLRELDGGVTELRCDVEALGGQVLSAKVHKLRALPDRRSQSSAY